MKESTTAHWRVDIQSLRALAVLLVIADHFGLPYLQGGFLGVDIFFVISGFLMTSLIVEALDNGSFTLKGFYIRRVRRLLPAAYATVVVTTVLAPLLLDPFELRSLAFQVAGAFTFSTNIVLWHQVDYFNNASELKPLLHMWSLAVEEQYYIVIPFILMACAVRWRLAVALVLALASLVVCLWFVQRSPSASFYLLPFRAWELGIGSIAALVVRQWGVLRLGGVPARRIGALLLVGVPVLATSAGHPGWVALCICLVTVFLMVSGRPQHDAGLLRGLTWIGDRSYSLYLVHWPVRAFANNLSIDDASAWSVVVSLALIVVWTEFQYRLVEQRFRHMTLTRATVAALVAIPLAVTGFIFAWSFLVDDKGVSDRAGNPGFAWVCESEGDYARSAVCESRADVEVMLWGDSYAMHLANGLAASSPVGVAQATRSVCGPLLGLAPLDDIRKRPWAEKCIRFNQSVIDHLRDHPEIHTVVLSSVFKQYVPGAEPERGWRSLVQTDGGYQEVALRLQVAEHALQATVDALRGIGKRVVLVAPPPSTHFDIGRCLLRESAGKPSIAAGPGCTIALRDYQADRRWVRGFLRQVESMAIVPVIWFDGLLCDDSVCQTRLSGVPLYSDSGHFSVAGSREVALRMDLGRLVIQAAR